MTATFGGTTPSTSAPAPAPAPAAAFAQLVDTLSSGNVCLKYAKTTPTDGASFSLYRTTTHTGGSPGYVNGAFRVVNNVMTNVTADEWAATFVLENYAVLQSGAGVSAAPQNVAMYAQANRRVKNASPTWAACIEASDYSGEENPGTALIGAEIDLAATGGDANAQRIGVDMFLNTAPGQTKPAQAFAGYRISALGTQFVNGWFSQGNVDCDFRSSSTGTWGTRIDGKKIVALSTEGCDTKTALRIGGGQRIELEGTGTAYVTYNVNAGQFEFWFGKKLVQAFRV